MGIETIELVLTVALVQKQQILVNENEMKDELLITVTVSHNSVNAQPKLD